MNELVEMIRDAIRRFEVETRPAHHTVVDDPDRSAAWSDGFNAGFDAGFEAGQREPKAEEDA